MATVARRLDPLAALAAAVGDANLRTDAASCAFYAQDVYTVGAPALAVVRPTDTAMLAHAVAAATEGGLPIVPRGGGMSYTSGYLAGGGAVVIDMGALDRVLDVRADDMTVTVEAGCTWEALYKALKPHGLRTPMWGSLSGRYATVGGGMSQNAAFWGSGRHGSAVESALSFEVVLADGTILATGPGHLRHYGPDLTGLFGGDAGAFGIKATVTLKLILEPGGLAHGSFAFAEQAQVIAAMAAVARAGLAAECFAFDPYLQSIRMRRESLASDAKALVGMMRAQGSVLGALREGARVAAAGRSFLGDGWSVHVNCEGRHARSAGADLADVRAIMAREGGREVENSVPKVLRANPFGPVNSMLGPDGERWVPVHGIVALSRAAPAYVTIRALFAWHEDAMERLGVTAGALFTTVGTTGFLIEPVFFWPDARHALHDASVEAAHLARLKTYPPDPAGRALVERLRVETIAILEAHGAAYYQIGRAYPWARSLAPTARGAMNALKRALDPADLMNPGALFGP